MESLASVSRKIASASNGTLRSSGTKVGAIRLSPSVARSIISEEQINEFFRLAGFDVNHVLPAPSKYSSKFSTYVIQNRKNELEWYLVVLGIGRNRGQFFEDRLFEEFKCITEKDQVTQRVKKLLENLNINEKQVKYVKQTSNTKVRRPITLGPQNVGSIISDVTLILEDESEIYLSVKNKIGSTFANSGYNSGFILLGNEIVPGSHILDDFVESLGVDKEHAAQGWTNFLNGKGELLQTKVNPKQNLEKVKHYLNGAYGYGYWYVREKGDDFIVRDLNDKENLCTLVSDIKEIELRYPGKTKQVTAVVKTLNETYVVEIRNTKGLIKPSEIKVKIR